MPKKSVLILGLAMVCFFAYGLTTREHSRRSAIPIEEAVRLASIRAFQWNSKAQLLFATSQDVDVAGADSDLGLDGGRRAWAVQFKEPDTNRTIFVEVRDGKIAKFRESGNIDSRPGIPPSSLNVEGKELAAAVRRSGLLPGKDWAIGYHFVFAYDFEMGHYVEVLGRNGDGSRGHRIFQAHSGRLVD